MSSRSTLLTAFAVSAALTACAGARPMAGGSQVTVHFKMLDEPKMVCPYEVSVEPSKRCGWLIKTKDCLKTLPGQTVVFSARRDDKPDAREELEFSIDFDPFKRGNNMFKGDKDHKLELPLDSRSPPKEYTYNVFSGECPVLDPTIIIRK